jgi:hypothetical protein
VTTIASEHDDATLRSVARSAIDGHSYRKVMSGVADISQRDVARRTSTAVGTLVASGLAIEFCGHLVATPALVTVGDRAIAMESDAFDRAERDELEPDEQDPYYLDDHDFLEDALLDVALTAGVWRWEGHSLEREARLAVIRMRLFIAALIVIGIPIGIAILVIAGVVAVIADLPKDIQRGWHWVVSRVAR